MSTEQVIKKFSEEQTATYPPKDSEIINSSEKKLDGNVISSKVDINVLMDRVRTERNKEKKENLIFLGLIASVIVITGIIASF